MSEHKREIILNRPVDLEMQMTEAIQDGALPDIHFNGFINAVTQGDILIVLLRHGRSVAKLSASYTVAKTLAQKLAVAIANLEQETGNTIMTTEDIEKASSRRDRNESDSGQ